jgi:hypothetical protein
MKRFTFATLIDSKFISANGAVDVHHGDYNMTGKLHN